MLKYDEVYFVSDNGAINHVRVGFFQNEEFSSSPVALAFFLRGAYFDKLYEHLGKLAKVTCEQNVDKISDSNSGRQVSGLPSYTSTDLVATDFDQICASFYLANDHLN